MSQINVRVVTESGISFRTMTSKELVQARNDLRKSAYETMKNVSVKPKHIVYYHDERKADQITDAWLYYKLVGLSDDDFYLRTSVINGLVGAIHY